MGTAIEPTDLHTERLLLRPFTADDADALFLIYAADDVARFAQPEAITRTAIEKGLANPSPWSERPRFAVVLDGRVVGDIVLQIDTANQAANLGYVIARELWGKGLATEAAQAVVDYGFRTCELAKIYARADPRNTGSVRVMEKLGMQREGLLRSHVVRRGERADRVYYGLLREEWQSGASLGRRRR